MRVKGWDNTYKSKSPFYKLTPNYSILFKNPNRKPKPSKPSKPPLNTGEILDELPFTTDRHFTVQTTTVYSYSSYEKPVTPWIVAAVDNGTDADTMDLLHPLTLKPLIYDLPENFDLFNYDDRLASFHHTEFDLDKLVIQLPKSKIMSDNTLIALYGGGNLIGRPFLIEREVSTPWSMVSDEMFDDIFLLGHRHLTYVVDRLGRLYVINKIVKSRVLRLGRAVITQPVTPELGSNGWRKRFVEDQNHSSLKLVVRVEEKVFRVYKFSGECMSGYWVEDKCFLSGRVLFVSKDCCFIVDEFKGGEYADCIVFTQAGFPKYSDDGWEYNDGDEIWAFRMTDDKYGRVGESVDFPEIDWSPPSWIFGDDESRSASPSRSHSEGEPDEDDEGAQSDLKDSNNNDEDEQECMENDSNSLNDEQEERSDSDIQDMEDEEMQSNTNDEDMSLQEDVPASLSASVSAVEDEVTKTLLRLNGGTVAVDEESSRKSIAQSAPKACSSSTTKVLTTKYYPAQSTVRTSTSPSCYEGYKSDFATAKFEGFDIRSDLVPTVKKIRMNHGNIIENSTIRNGDIIARALESLATVVDILDHNPVQTLSDFEAGYLSSTLSDLKIMGFKVDWLVSSVEKAVKLHKSKALVASLNKLSKLSSQVKERRDILLDEVAKLNEEDNKLKKEMAKVSKLIPFSGQVKFDEPLGSGLRP